MEVQSVHTSPIKLFVHFTRYPSQNLVTTTLVLLVTCVLIMIINNLPYQVYSKKMRGATLSYEIAKVISVNAENLRDSKQHHDIKVGSQNLSVELLTGPYSGQILPATNALSTYNSVQGKVSNYLIVVIDKLSNGKFKIRVYNHYRSIYIYAMLLIFFSALLLVGRKKGLMAVFSLVYTFLCILTIFLPLILRGYSPILAAILLVILSSTVTMLALNGLSIKTLCCILGTVFGVVMSSLLLILSGSIMHISGLNMEETEALLLIAQSTGLQVSELLYSGILITALGAIMDVAMSIVSSINEVKEHKPDAGSNVLFTTGMNVGKDIIGTMSNTLILVFTGTSLNTFVIISSYSVQYNQYMNMNNTAIQITQALAGSLGLVLTVPMTAFITSRLLMKK